MSARILTYCKIFLKSEVLKLSATLDIWQMQESIKNLVCGSHLQSQHPRRQKLVAPSKCKSIWATE